MSFHLSKIEVRKDGSSDTFRAYVVRNGDEWTCFEVTRELEALDREDRDDGYAAETGPRFGFGVYNALRAVEVHSAWPSGGQEKIRVPFRGSWRTFQKSSSRVVRTWEL